MGRDPAAEVDTDRVKIDALSPLQKAAVLVMNLPEDVVRQLLGQLDVDLQDSLLVASFAGVVSQRYVDEGSVVAPTTQLLPQLQTALASG